VATFTGLTLDKVNTPATPSYTIEATSGDLTSTTQVITVTAAPATQLVVTAQPPATVIAGDSFGLTVSAEDPFGNVDATFGGNVTVAMASNPGGGSLGGTTTVQAIDGVATFSDLMLNRAGSGATLQTSTSGLTAGTSDPFSVTGAPATQLVETTPPPATVTAGTPFGLTVKAEDPFGDGDSSFTGNVTIALATDPGGGSLGGTTTVQAVDGVAAFSDLMLDQAGSGYTLQTSTSGLTAGTSDPFSVTGAPATQLVVTTQPPATLTAGSSFGLTVWAEDPFGNVDPTFTGNVTVGPVNNPDGTTTTTVAALDGVVPFSGLILKLAGTHSLSLSATAAGGGPIAGSTVPFTVTAAAATKLAVTAPPPASITTGESFGLTVSAEDQYGNVDPTFGGSVAIALASFPAGGSLTGTTSATASKGIVTFSGLTLNKVGVGYTLQATSSSGLTSATTTDMTVTAAATQLVITAQPPTSVTAGGVFGFTVAAEDDNGNVVTSFNGQITAVLYDSAGDIASLVGRTAVTAVGGVATFSALTFDGVGNGYTIQLSGGGLVATSDTLDIVPGAAAQLSITAQPPLSVTAGSGFGVTVQVEDAFGDAVSAFDGSLTVAMANNPGNGTLGGSLTVTAVAGVATFSGLRITTASTGDTLQISGSGLAAATSNPLDVAPATATQLVITAQPPSGVAVGSSFGLTLSAEDQYNNVATSFVGNVTVTLANNPGGGTLGGTTTVTAVAGVATFSGLTIDAVGIGYTLQASSGSLNATSGAFNVTSGPATQLVIAAQPPTGVAAGTPFGLAVTAEDRYNNVATGFSGSVVVALVNPDGVILGGTTTVTAVAGIATFSGLTIDTTNVDGYTLQVTAGALSTTTGTVTVAPGTTTQLVITEQPVTNVTAGGGFGMTVTAEDAFGNTATSFRENVSIALADDPGGGALRGRLTVAAVGGVATFAGLTITAAATGYTFQVSSGSLNTTSDPLEVDPGAATQLAITEEPPTSVAAGSPFGLTVAVEDQYNNVETTTFVGDVTVALGVNPGDTTLGGTTTVTGTGGGSINFVGMTIDVASAGYTIRATCTGLASATSSGLTVTPAATTQLVISSQPPVGVVAGAPFGLTLTAKDDFGNVTTGFNGSVDVALADNITGVALGGTTSITAVGGYAIFTGLTIDTTGAGYALQVSSGGLESTTGTMTVAPGAATQLVMTNPPPSGVTAGSGFGLTVAAEDKFGNTAVFSGNMTVSLASNPGGGPLSGRTTVAAVGGFATFTGLTIDTAGAGYTLEVKAGILSTTSDLMDVSPATATQLVVTGQPPSKVGAGGGFSVVISAEDPYGNVDPTFDGSVTVALANNPGGDTLGGTLTPILSNGVATFSALTLEIVANGYTLEATTSGLAATATNPFNVTAAAATQMVVTSQPSATVTAGGGFGLTVKAEDPFGNVDLTFDGSVTVSVANNPDGATLGGSFTATASKGVATFPALTLDKAGTGSTLQVTSNGLTPATTSDINVTRATTTQLVVITQPPGSVIAGGGIGLVIAAEDAFGNVDQSFGGSVTVALADNPGGGTLDGTLTVAASQGIATFSGLTLDQAGSGYTLQAINLGLTGAMTGAFNVTPGPAAQVAVTSQPPADVDVGNGFGLAVSVEDRFGNVETTLSGSVTLALASNPGGATLGGILTVAAPAGVATFSGLTIDSAGTGYTLRATSSGLASTTTVPFNETAAPVPRLAVYGQPATVVVGGYFQITVVAEDAQGATDTSFTGSVTLALASNPGGATLGGTVTLPVSDGMLTFYGLTLNVPGSGYTIQATSSGFTPATSSPITVDTLPATQLIVITPPPSSVTANGDFGLTVAVVDAAGHLAPGYDGSVTVALAGQRGKGKLSGTLTVAAIDGVATFSGLTLTKAGKGETLRLTGTGLTPTTTSPFIVNPAARPLKVTRHPHPLEAKRTKARG
jgi:hypothetical protein